MGHFVNIAACKICKFSRNFEIFYFFIKFQDVE